jgi:GNAT superfamily N-acetyltransferase
VRVEVAEEPSSALDDYARIPMALEVRSILDVTPRTGGFDLVERRIDAPYVKDYDADPAEGPRSWVRRFDLSRWAFFAARADARRVGGAVVVMDAERIHMCEGRSDLAVLWDIRVAPEAQGRGIGSALFRAAEAWSFGHGARRLKIETQNVNVPACRFYARCGCELRAIDPLAYPGLPDEVQLLWYKDLGQRSDAG